MMTRTLTPILAAVLLATAPMVHAATAAAPAATADSVIKVVYHVNDSDNATAAMRNIKNELNAEPNTKVVVVTHSKGIDFLLSGAQDKNGNPYEPAVQELKARGVEFRVCNNTLKQKKVTST